MIELAVRGLVRRGARVLLVRMNYGPLKGKWLLPGGLVNQGETLLAAAVREVMEESGVEMAPTGVLALRHFVSGDRSNLLTVVAGEWAAGEPTPDGHEVDRAGFFEPEEALALDGLYPVARLAITLAGEQANGLRPHPGANPRFQFFLPAGLAVPPDLVPDRP